MDAAPSITQPQAVAGPAPKLAHICIVSSGAEGGMGLSIKRGFEALGRRVTYLPYLDWLPTLGQATFRGSGLINRGLAMVTRPAIEVRLIAAMGRVPTRPRAVREVR